MVTGAGDMSISSRSANTIAVVTVHGTGDTAEHLDGPKWFQRGSVFSDALKDRLSERNVDIEIVPFIWSGANSASEREAGAESLARVIKHTARRFCGVHVIGHSHGGNVANTAALLLRWGRDRRGSSKHAMTSLTTIGTPFLNSRSSALQSIWGFLFLVVTCTSVPLFVTSMSILALWVLGDSGLIALEYSDPLGLGISNGAVGEIIDGLCAKAGVQASIGDAIFLVGCILGVGLPLWYMVHLALRSWRQIIRPRSSTGTEASVFAIWHGNDEAISFLQQIESLALEPLPKGSFLRGSRTLALSAGVLGVVVGAISPALVLIALSFGWVSVSWASTSIFWLWTSTLSVLLMAPLLFAAIYLLLRVFVGSAGEVVARPPLNRWVVSVFRGIAFGSDNDQSIGDVSTKSHTLQTKEHRVEGAVGQRMQANSAGAAAKLIEKYRWALFTVGADTNARLTDMSTDAMSWQSLIHTTYFDQPEIADLIAEHIADEARSAKMSEAAAALTSKPVNAAKSPPKQEIEMEASQPANTSPEAATRRRSRPSVLLGVAAMVILSAIGSFLILRGPALRNTPSASHPFVSGVAPVAAPTLQAQEGVFRDCADANLCPEMKTLSGGRFLMGAGTDDLGRHPWEEPQHPVTVPAFSISTREVTFAEWDACAKAGGCRHYFPPDHAWGQGARPVINVSWRDAQSYVRWLSKLTGRAYRLPSEAEWEFAARGGTPTVYWWGQGFETSRTPVRQTAPTGSFAPNAFGLYDVTGNVSEWVEDCYVNTYVGAPVDGRAVESQTCERRVVRGGSWRDGPAGLRISGRTRVEQTVRDNAIGFRLARAP
jgi:formylglycine-generating enzyme required for sulfatase activity